MIWYKSHMGPQTCVGGVISQSSKQYMYPSDEKISLGCYLPSYSPPASCNPRQIILSSAKTIGPLPFLSISIETTSSIPSPEKPSESRVNPCTEILVDSQTDKPRANSKPHQSATLHHLYLKRPHCQSINTDNSQTQAPNHSQAIHVSHSQLIKRSIHQIQSLNDEKRGILINQSLSPQLPCRNLVSTSSPGAVTVSASFQGGNYNSPGDKLIRKDCADNFFSSDSLKGIECMPCGQRMMNEGEEKDFWDKEKVNNDTSRPGSAPGDEAGSASSSGSLHVSDASEDSQGNQGTCTKKDQRGSSGEPPFYFLGPVGKKRKYCRDRQKSQDPEPQSPSSLLLPRTAMGGDSDLKDLSLIEGPGSLEIDKGFGQSSSSRSVNRIGREDYVPTTITSTPTPVIRSVPHRHRDEPLNLSLPSPSEAQISTIRSPSRKNESVQVSVISLAPREREEENDSSFQDISSPSLSFYSSRSPRGSSGELTPSGALISPVPSTSRGFHSISSGAESLTAVPSTFQGLLVAHGIISPNGSRSPLKKKLQCKDCGKEFSQLRNFRYHRSRHEGTQQFSCTCPVCGKTFNDKGYLSSHLKIHRNAKEYKCEWCEKSFNQRVAYNMHVRIHTGHKPHKCPMCPKAFSRKMLLRQHLRTHTGERPYKCEICGKAFADRSNMLLHQRLHSGQRPYKCDECGKSFSKNHHLKTHINHHKGIKPYQCEKCKACFSQSSNMKTHFRKCSGVSTVAATITSGPSDRQLIPPDSSGRSSSGLASLSSPTALPQYSVRQEEMDEQDLHHHHQQLLQAQQNHLKPTHLQQFASSQQHQQLLRSGHQSPSTLGQVAAVQALGLNLGIMGLATPGGRSRRAASVGMNLLPLGSPSPTSLAAGHPFIPLATVESVATSGAPSPLSMPPHPSVILMSSRHHSNTSETSGGFPNHSPLSHSPQQQRSVGSRSRPAQPHRQQYIYQPNHSDTINENRVHQQHPSPQLLLNSRPSPQRNNNPYRSESPESYEILLPALAVRSIPQNGHQFQQEQFAQQMRPHGHHYQRAGQVAGMNGTGSNRQHVNMFTGTRSSSETSGLMPHEDTFPGSLSPIHFSEQELIRHPSLWRPRENDETKQDFKDGQFRSSNS